MKENPIDFKEKTAAIIVAGGSGMRMNSVTPKQFLPLDGKPLLWYSIKAFTDTIPQIRIIVVLPEAHIEEGKRLLQQTVSYHNISWIAGGHTRFHSVKNGINALKDEHIVFVHDGVRPFISESIIRNCYTEAVIHGTAIPCIPINDSIRQIRETGESRAINRDQLRAVQTPQTFRADILQNIFQQEYREAFTDEATVAEHAGHTIFLCEGDRHNIKITTPEDMLIAEMICRKKAENSSAKASQSFS